MNKYFIGFLVIVILLVAGCNSNKKEVKPISEESIGLRDVSLYDEDVLVTDMQNYVGGAPGKNENIDRSFENAPPLIPHTVKGFFPITTTKNICLTFNSSLM